MQDQLHIVFDEAGLREVQASGQQVALARAVDGNEIRSIWLSFAPLIHNTIAWEEHYQIYSGNSPAPAGPELGHLPEPVRPRWTFTVLLSSTAKPGEVLSSLPANALTFEPHEAVTNVAYDTAKQAFVLG